MKKELLALGLEEKEADLYLACTANNRCTPTELAQRTKIKRTTVYFYLEKLQEKELIAFDIHGARKHISVISPKSAFTQFLQSKKESLRREEEILRDLVSNLENISPRDEKHSRVYVYEGEEGARFAVRKIIEKKQNVYWLGSFETLLGVLSAK